IGSTTSVVVLALDRPYLSLIFFQRIYVDHPVEDEGNEGSASSCTFGFSSDRAAEPELGMRAERITLPERSFAIVHVLMPLCDAQRNTLIEIVFRKALGRR